MHQKALTPQKASRSVEYGPHTLQFDFMFALGIFLVAAAPDCRADSPETVFTPQQVQTSLARGIEFLLRDQNTDGSWGSHRDAVLGLDDPFMNAPSQKAFTVGTSALGCIALAESEP